MECDDAFVKKKKILPESYVRSFTYSAVTNKNSKYNNVITSSQIVNKKKCNIENKEMVEKS